MFIYFNLEFKLKAKYNIVYLILLFIIINFSIRIISNENKIVNMKRELMSNNYAILKVKGTGKLRIFNYKEYL